MIFHVNINKSCSESINTSRVLVEGNISRKKGRISERMGCEESVIFFANLAYIPPILDKISTKIYLKKVVSTEEPGIEYLP